MRLMRPGRMYHEPTVPLFAPEVEIAQKELWFIITQWSLASGKPAKENCRPEIQRQVKYLCFSKASAHQIPALTALPSDGNKL